MNEARWLLIEHVDLFPRAWVALSLISVYLSKVVLALNMVNPVD